MGAEYGKPYEMPICLTFKQLYDKIKKQSSKFTLISDINKASKKITDNSFIPKYYDIVYDQKLDFPSKNDIEEIFTKIIGLINRFSIFLDSHNRSAENNVSFASDFLYVCEAITVFMNSIYPILDKYVPNDPNPRIQSQIDIEIILFKYSFRYEQLDRPPFFITHIMHTYLCHDDFVKNKLNYLNFIMPDGTGRSQCVPLFLASVICSQYYTSPFIVMVEPTSAKIKSLRKFFKNHASQSFDMVKNLIEMKQDFLNKKCKPVLCILSPMELILFMQDVKMSSDFFNNAYFVVDNVQDRSTDIDVLLTLLKENITKNQQYPNHLVLLSSFNDLTISQYFKPIQSLSYSVRIPFSPDADEINGKDPRDVNQYKMIQQTMEVLTSWAEDEDSLPASPGPILCYLSSDNQCKKFLSSLKQASEDELQGSEFPPIVLETIAKPNQTAQEFFQDLITEKEILEVERQNEIEGKTPIFVIPVPFTSELNNNQRIIYQSALPATLSNFVRVFAISPRSESLFSMNDVSIIIDSGLSEDYHYDVNSGLSYLIEEPIPEPMQEKRMEILGRVRFGYAYLIRIEDADVSQTVVPHILKDDICKCMFNLRAANIQFENIQNFPTNPPQQSQKAALDYLMSLKVLNNNKKLNELGLEAIPYSCLPPVLAVATANFKYVNQYGVYAGLFGAFTFLLVEYGASLCINDTAENLLNNFCYESDIVTLLKATRSVFPIKKESKSQTDNFYIANGFDAGIMRLIRSLFRQIIQRMNNYKGGITLSGEFEKMWEWVTSTHLSLLELVDRLIASIKATDAKWLSIREASFKTVLGVGFGLPLTIMFLGHSSFNFVDQTQPGQIRLQQRPGWNGFGVPGNVYILSVQSNKSTRTNFGSIVHRNPDKNGNFGVVSKEVPSTFDTPFFVPLVEASFGKKPSKSDFVQINLGKTENNTVSYLTHISQSGKKLFLNYCPKSNKVHNEMMNTIEIVKKIVPFAARSILIQYKNLDCFIEIMSVGSSEFTKSFFFYNIPAYANTTPVAYNVTHNVLEFLAKDPHKLAATFPQYRLAVTGECCLLKEKDGNTVDIDVEYPCTDPTLKTVFCEKPSHMVLIVDPSEPAIPNEQKIEWASKATKFQTGVEDTGCIEELADLYVRGNGRAGKDADGFIAMFQDSALYASEGIVPDDLRVNCKAKDGKTIQCHMNDLREHFTNEYFKQEHLPDDTPIPLKKISTRVTDGKHATTMTNNEKGKLQRDCPKNIAGRLGIAPENVIVELFGQEGVLIRVKSCPQDKLRKEGNDMHTVKYNESEAQKIIKEEINKIIGVKPVTRVYHMQLITFKLMLFNEHRMSENEYCNIVDQICDKYGFYIFRKSDLMNPPRGAKEKVFMFVDVLEPYVAISFAQDVKNKILIDDSFNGNNALQQTMNILSKTRSARGGAQIKTRWDEEVIPASQQEIDAVKRIMAKSNVKMDGAKYDEQYQVLIVPADEKEEYNKYFRQFKRNELNIYELGMCADPENPDFMLNRIPAFNEDGSVDLIAACRMCMKVQLMTTVEFFFNSTTKHLDIQKLHQINGCPQYLSAEVDKENALTRETWPTRPLALYVWILLMDPVLAPYTKAWVTGVAENTVRNSPQYITQCPFHPGELLRYPEIQGQSLKCKHCDYIFCDGCKSWHDYKNDCPTQNTFKHKCPRCNLPSVKTKGCNRITCRCGCSWCYECGAGFDTVQQCYDHLNAVHGSYWNPVND